VAVQADAAGMKIDEGFLNPEVDADSDNSSSKAILGIHGPWGELDSWTGLVLLAVTHNLILSECARPIYFGQQ
jgi:hypothetical protein